MEAQNCQQKDWIHCQGMCVRFYQSENMENQLPTPLLKNLRQHSGSNITHTQRCHKIDKLFQHYFENF